jgi:hypothetical protein
MLKRWHWLLGGPVPDVPFVSSARMLDIGGTMVAAIASAPANCVAIAMGCTLFQLNAKAIADCERAARRKGLRLLWIRRRARTLSAQDRQTEG